MEQEAVFDLGDFDAKSVTVNIPPRSALHYLQQTAVERSKCSAVVSVSESLASSVRPSSSSAKRIPETTTSAVIPNLPSEEWCRAKCSLFSQYRSEIEVKRPSCPISKRTVTLPAAADYKQWIKFCGLEKPNKYSIANEKQCCGQGSKSGISRTPTIPLMLSLSENRVNYLVEHLTKFFLENGYSRELFEWFYGVLLVLQNPPPSDECSAIREFAKHAKILRSSLDSEVNDRSGSLLYELSLFVAIISIYFEQKDLADYPQVTSVTIH